MQRVIIVNVPFLLKQRKSRILDYNKYWSYILEKDREIQYLILQRNLEGRHHFLRKRESTSRNKECGFVRTKQLNKLLYSKKLHSEFYSFDWSLIF